MGPLFPEFGFAEGETFASSKLGSTRVGQKSLLSRRRTLPYDCLSIQAFAKRVSSPLTARSVTLGSAIRSFELMVSVFVLKSRFETMENGLWSGETEDDSIGETGSKSIVS